MTLCPRHAVNAGVINYEKNIEQRRFIILYYVRESIPPSKYNEYVLLHSQRVLVCLKTTAAAAASTRRSGELLRRSGLYFFFFLPFPLHYQNDRNERKRCVYTRGRICRTTLSLIFFSTTSVSFLQIKLKISQTNFIFKNDWPNRIVTGGGGFFSVIYGGGTNKID